MKVITQGMVRIGAYDEKAQKLRVAYVKPGTHELDDSIAKELLDKGVARRPGTSDDKAAGESRGQAKPQGNGGRA